MVNPVPVEPVTTFSDTLESCGIRWYFDREYEVGTFINGDPWVKADNSGQLVKIVRIDPSPRYEYIERDNASQDNTRVHLNGTQIDPLYGESHGFDSAADSRFVWNSAVNHYTNLEHPGHIKYESGLNAGLKLTTGGFIEVSGKSWGTSVVSTESTSFWEGDKWQDYRISKAGVLTVYDTGSSPAVTLFRPPYCKHPGILSGNAGVSGVPSHYNSYNQSSVIQDTRRIGITGFTTTTALPDITGVYGSFRCPRLDHLGASGNFPLSRPKFVNDQYQIMPKDQVYTDGRDIAVLVGQAALLYHLTGNAPFAQNDDTSLYDLKINVVQRAIDNLGIAESFYENVPAGRTGTGVPVRYVHSGSDKWGANHGLTNNCGRKMELLLGGYFLTGDPRMIKEGRKLVFQEDEQTFLIDQTTLRVGKNYLSGDVGTAEWGVKHGAGGSSLDDRNWAAPSVYDNARANDGAGSWWGQELASRIMDWQTGNGWWDWNPFHSYQLRYNTLQSTNNAIDRQKAWDPWSYNMWTGNDGSYSRV